MEIEEEEDLKQEENVLKEEENQMYQMNLKGGRGPILTQAQEREIMNMVLANNAIRLREIQANIIGDHAIFNTVFYDWINTKIKSITQLSKPLLKEQNNSSDLHHYKHMSTSHFLRNNTHK